MRLFVLATSIGVLSCAGTATLPREPDPIPHGEARRRPDGVAVDPESAPLLVRDAARSDEGLVALRTPLGLDRALAVVSELMKRIVQEDGEALGALFAPDAHVVATGTGTITASSPQAWWELRFKRLDYTRLAGEPLFRESEVDFFRAGDDPERASPRLMVESLDEGDVVVRVPISTPRIGIDRLLGDEMVLWMRRQGDRYRIYRVMEDFQLN